MRLASVRAATTPAARAMRRFSLIGEGPGVPSTAARVRGSKGPKRTAHNSVAEPSVAAGARSARLGDSNAAGVLRTADRHGGLSPQPGM